MHGCPRGIQVEKVIEDQKKYLSDQIDETNKVMEENLNELEKLVAEFDDLFKDNES